MGPWVSGVTVASSARLRKVENGELYPGAEQSDRARIFRNGFSIVETTGRPNRIANGPASLQRLFGHCWLALPVPIRWHFLRPEAPPKRATGAPKNLYRQARTAHQLIYAMDVVALLGVGLFSCGLMLDVRFQSMREPFARTKKG